MKSIFALFAVMWLLFSCKSDSEETINPLGSAVRFSLAEYMDGNVSNLTFKFLTEKDFPCINYQIAQQTEVSGNQVTVLLKEVQEADVCLNASGPASAFVDLGKMDEGEYTLVVKIGSAVSSTGKLVVSENAYNVTMEDNAEVIVDNPVLRRIPDNIIWGTIRYHQAPTQGSVRNTLTNHLKGIGALEKKLAEGDYFYFSVDAAGRLKSDEQGEAEETFLMEYNGSNDQIEAVLQQLEHKVGQQATIRIYNTHGEEFRTFPL